jgi:hypothetical protein
MTELEQSVLDFVNAHPETTIADISAKFHLSSDEAEGMLQSIYDQLSDKAHE